MPSQAKKFMWNGQERTILEIANFEGVSDQQARNYIANGYAWTEDIPWRRPGAGKKPKAIVVARVIPQQVSSNTEGGQSHDMSIFIRHPRLREAIRYIAGQEMDYQAAFDALWAYICKGNIFGQYTANQVKQLLKGNGANGHHAEDMPEEKESRVGRLVQDAFRQIEELEEQYDKLSKEHKQVLKRNKFLERRWEAFISLARNTKEEE